MRLPLHFLVFTLYFYILGIVATFFLWEFGRGLDFNVFLYQVTMQASTRHAFRGVHKHVWTHDCWFWRTRCPILSECNLFPRCGRTRCLGFASWECVVSIFCMCCIGSWKDLDFVFYKFSLLFILIRNKHKVIWLRKLHGIHVSISISLFVLRRSR